MSRTKVVVATQKPKTFYAVVKILTHLKLDFDTCHPGEPLCDIAHVVITTLSESRGLDKSRLVIVEDIPNEMVTQIDIMMHLLGIAVPSEIAVGIDPGLHLGLAVLFDGNTVYANTYASPIVAADTTSSLTHTLHKRFPRPPIKIRVGKGTKLYSTLFLRALALCPPVGVIRMVDEKHTTVPKGYETDQSSAVLIAARRGRDVEQTDYEIEPKNGYVRALCHLYEWLTDGKKTLSLEDARAVLSGSVSLSEAL
jgi:hypothetical protein